MWAPGPTNRSGGLGTISGMSGPSVPDPDAAPGVSVILPVRDEERHLRAAVGQVLAQDYAGPLEVVLAVGPSRDRTWEIATELAAADPRLRVVANPSGRTPAALNLAVAAARYDVLVRVDGHSEIAADYVSRAVEVLRATGAANVGGMMVPVGTTPFENAVARAMSSPLGIGSVAFHTGGEAGPAPTVYLGVFRRDALERVGGFDETFVRAQDWELNHRLRAAGEVVWFDPTLAVTYRPRGSWSELARQFFRTGRWRRQVIRTYPETASLRYLAPPATVLGVAVGTVAAVLGATTGPRWLLLGAAAPGVYAAFLVVATAAMGRGLETAARWRLPGVVATMQMAWGSGFLRGVERPGPVTDVAPHEEGTPRPGGYPGSAPAPGRSGRPPLDGGHESPED